MPNSSKMVISLSFDWLPLAIRSDKFEAPFGADLSNPV
jgi:hypothetical protein